MEISEETRPETEPLWTRFKSGISYNSTLAVLYAIFVYIPAQMYLTLVTGGAAAIPVALFTLLLWVELGKMSGKYLTKQEGYMIMILSGAELVIPTSFVYSAWFRQSSIVEAFGYGPEIPYWVAPAPETNVFAMRTFFHPAWAAPMTLWLLGTAIGLTLNITLGLYAREVFIETEHLPFPILDINVKTIEVLTGKEEQRFRLLSAFTLIGFIYGFVVYALPFVIQAWTGQAVVTVPVPWIDLTSSVEQKFPGAQFGFATDLGVVATAFVLPIWTIISIIIGSFSVMFFGNWFIVSRSVGTSWWLPGMTIPTILQRSIHYFWFGPLIGLGLAAGLLPLITRPNVIIRSLRSLRRETSLGRGRATDPVRPILIFGPMLAALIGGVVIFAVLVPDFFLSNLWIIAPMLVFPFIITLVGGRMIGETGISSASNLSGLQSLMYFFSGYKGVDVWFAPSVMFASGETTLTWYRMSQLTETTVKSFLKMLLIFFPLAMFVGLMYVQIFWSIAPIPSERYPGAAIYWPLSAIGTSLWIKGRALGIFDPITILYAFLVGAAIYLPTTFLHLPFQFTGFAVGVGTVIPVAMTYILGLVVRQVVQLRTGKEWWSKNNLIISGGIVLGEGIAVIISIAIAAIINSIWLLPY